MATFGVEGIRYFSHLRAPEKWPTRRDLTYVFNICNGFDSALRNAGHTRKFYWANRDVWENDLHSTNMGGDDDAWSDNVDAFFILTHGNHEAGHALLAYDININEWIGNSVNWRLGNINCEWLFVFGCHTCRSRQSAQLLGHFPTPAPVLRRLRRHVGFNYDRRMRRGYRRRLTDGDTVASSWIDGCSDWLLDNHPIVLSAERQSTWNGGNFDWPNTTLNRDHFWGHGTTVSDIFPADKFWLSWRWSEG